MKSHIFNIGGKFFDKASEIQEFIKDKKTTLYYISPFGLRLESVDVIKIGNKFYRESNFSLVTDTALFSTIEEAKKYPREYLKRQLKSYKENVKRTEADLKKLQDLKK